MKKLNNKKISLIIIIFVISTFLVDHTLSFLTRTTSEVSNTFKKGNVELEIIEQFDGRTKSSIKLRNNSSVAEYIRVKIVSNYINDKDEIVSSKKEELDLKANEWWQLKDGIYYYKKIVNPGEEIEFLKEPLSLKLDENGNRQVIEVLSSVVQAYPKTAAEEVWKVNIENGEIR